MGAPRDEYITFTGPGVREVQYLGRHIRVRETPSAAIFLQLDNGSVELERAAGEQVNLAPGDPPFQRVRVRSAVAQTVVLTFADVPQDDQRANVALSVSATVAGSTAVVPLAAVTVPPGNKVKIADANAKRVELRVAVKSDQPGEVYLGDSTLTAGEGGVLEPGTVDYIATSAEVWAFNPGLAAVEVSVLDLESP